MPQRDFYGKPKQPATAAPAFAQARTVMDSKLFNFPQFSSRKIEIPGTLHDIRVGMREVALQNGEKIVLYDTTGPYTREGYVPDIERGLPRLKEAWHRPGEEFHTQMWYARQGIVTPEMEYVAIRESCGDPGSGITPETVRQDVAAGRAVIPCSRTDDHRQPLPGEDQCQHRQLEARFRLGRRGRKGPLVGALGRRHGDGPLHGQQHPCLLYTSPSPRD